IYTMRDLNKDLKEWFDEFRDEFSSSWGSMQSGLISRIKETEGGYQELDGEDWPAATAESTGYTPDPNAGATGPGAGPGTGPAAIPAATTRAATPAAVATPAPNTPVATRTVATRTVAAWTPADPVRRAEPASRPTRTPTSDALQLAGPLQREVVVGQPGRERLRRRLHQRPPQLA